MSSLLALTLCSLLALEATSTSFLRSGQVTEADARSDLKVEMGPTLSPAHGERLSVLQQALAHTFRALPKNKHGNLDHQSVRYVIHRLFVQRYGWFVLGLEPGNETKNSLVKEWVPSYLQNILEKRFGDRGMDLVSLTSFAAALEDLVRRESVDRLRTTFDLHRVPKDRPIESKQDLKDIANSYYLSFLMSFNLEATDRRELESIKADFIRDYPGWAESKVWYEELLETEYKPAQGGAHTFQSAANFVSKIGERYYEFNDKECRNLKSTLHSMEGLKAGRVRLSTFYQKALYSHWRFTEKADYLKSLGALDESDSTNPQVIVSNYVMSRPNCLEVSNIYAICCRNECEGLMAHIEKEVAAPSAPPGQIAELVSALPSQTVEAPRKLSSTLLRRLDQVADLHGGKVLLHGRLFAQWMHHAYPRECPYPHELGTTSPQTPDEWMQGTGQKASTASPEEMKLSIDSDTCAIREDGNPSDCTEEQAGGSELPWSEAEELPIVAFAAAAGFPGLF